jgi:hypothetical protein
MSINFINIFMEKLMRPSATIVRNHESKPENYPSSPILVLQEVYPITAPIWSFLKIPASNEPVSANNASNQDSRDKRIKRAKMTPYAYSVPVITMSKLKCAR